MSAASWSLPVRATLKELNDSLRDVFTMILDDGMPVMTGEFAGIETVFAA